MAEFALSAGVLSCGSSGSSTTCGQGTMLSGHSCIADPPDAAADVGAAGRTPDSGAGALDAVPEAQPPADATTVNVGPSFKGVAGVAPASQSAIFVAWAAADSPLTPPERMTYQVFVEPSSTAVDYTKPVATTIPGATSFYAEQLVSAQTYRFAVRAVDEAGNTDRNTAVLTGQPAADTSSPTFGGAKTAAPGGSGKVLLAWDAAQDDQTPTAAMVYYVYVASASGVFDYSLPSMVTAPGVTSATMSDLYDGSQTYQFVVRARDAADNLDDNTTVVTAGPGPDTTPPTFAGCQTAIADSAGSAVVSWTQAQDDTTPASLITYDVYASTTEGHFDYTKRALSVKGADSGQVVDLTSNTTWYFVCRARDFAGNEDANVVERVTKTLADDTPPTFAGVTGAVVDSLARTVNLTWAAGMDDKTAQNEIVYDVYQAQAPDTENYTAAPLASSTPGATALLVTNLAPDTTLYWVVRARDQAGNHDSNTVEQSGAISVSFSEQVQVTFSQYCAVTGCHVPGNPVAGLILAPGFAYGGLVGNRSTEYPSELRVNPGDPSTSFLYQKVSLNPPPYGWQMPAPATGSVLTAAEKDVVRRWILQGAVNN
ncbi:MAG TPA: hypothetical protein VKU41_00700 [Polyangiaceae bacterium]|nr:hypothetical protein [Polyangiaceae bacterium]